MEKRMALSINRRRSGGGEMKVNLKVKAKS